MNRLRDEMKVGDRMFVKRTQIVLVDAVHEKDDFKPDPGFSELVLVENEERVLPHDVPDTINRLKGWF